MGDYEARTRNDVTDRRIRKTRAALKRSLTTLLREKNVRDISVKELTELADVNRGTFYLHYKDVFDLLEQSELDLLDELEEVFDRTPGKTFGKEPIKLFENVYDLCKENADFVRVLLSENGDIKFLNSMNSFLKEKALNDWGEEILKQIDIKNFDAYFTFLIGGCTSLLQYWFSTGMTKSPHELAKITVGFLNRSALIGMESADAAV